MESNVSTGVSTGASTGITQQSGFSAGSGGDFSSVATADTTASSTETSTNAGSASDGGGGSAPPAAATSGADNNTVAQSEKGSFVLRFNERTGRNEVVSTMPQETDDSDFQQESTAPVQRPASSYAGNELLQTMQQVSNQKEQPAQAPTADYSVTELQEAMRIGQVDETRIPLNLRQSYYLAVTGQQPATAGANSVENAEPQTEQQGSAAENQENSAEKAQKFYSRVQEMARERAMKEVGITQDEIDVAEYTDDQNLLNKFSAFQASVENNRAQILRDVDNIQRQQKAAEEDHRQAYQAVATFVEDMRKKDPNFNAIDKLMMTRTQNMPYSEAIKVVPLIEKVTSGNLTTADLPALQEMYNQTRLEFYSKREGVGLAPQVQKPAFVETPGTGGDAPRKTTPLSALGSMSKKQREAAIGQMFGNFFDED